MQQFNWGLPYITHRQSVMAQNIVATSQPLAAQAGIRMLHEGGNAVDAAIATAIALTVVEPTSNGLGSDSFALIWNEDDGELLGLNASGRSPKAWTYDHFSQYLDCGGKAGTSIGSMPRLGWDTVTVPGAVSAWVELSDRFGELKFEELFQPAISYAKDGFPVSPITARVWALAPEKYHGMSDFAKTFLPGGRAPLPGEIFRNTDLAHTLERLSWSGGDSFYREDLADQIADHAEKTGGLLTLEDLASHSADWVEPISVDYHGLTLHEIPPNGQGIAALEMLGILEHSEFDPAEMALGSPDSLHLQIEAMKLALADADRYVSDPDTMDLPPRDLLSESYLRKRANLITMKKAQDPGYGTPDRSGTVYLTTADESGMMVSYIQSNYMGFGSGIVVPGTGIALQNRGTGFSLEKGHPNQVDGGKRPFHTIIPAFVTRGGGGEGTGSSGAKGTGHREAVMSFGVMGGPMQAQGHAQMMIRMFDHGQDPQTAIDAPRWQVFPDMEVALEPGFGDDVASELARRGHRITREKEFWWYGGAQAICRLGRDGRSTRISGKGENGNGDNKKGDNGIFYCSGSDSRKDGHAVGF
jgi:gamma-glutamyltranspeptidase / glutathione hydrolase